MYAHPSDVRNVKGKAKGRASAAPAYIIHKPDGKRTLVLASSNSNIIHNSNNKNNDADAGESIGVIASSPRHQCCRVSSISPTRGRRQNVDSTMSPRGRSPHRVSPSPYSHSPQTMLMNSECSHHMLHDVNNSILEAELERQEATLRSLREALEEINEICRGHGSIDAATRAAEKEALGVGEEVAKLEDRLEIQQRRERELRATCGRLAGEAKALREYVPFLRAEVEELTKEANARGIVVDLTPLTLERALRNFRDQVEADCNMLKELQSEANAIDASIRAAVGLSSSRKASCEEQQEELRRLEGQESTLTADVQDLEEEVAVNEEVLTELKRQISLASQQILEIESRFR